MIHFNWNAYILTHFSSSFYTRERFDFVFLFFSLFSFLPNLNCGIRNAQIWTNKEVQFLHFPNDIWTLGTLGPENVCCMPFTKVLGFDWCVGHILYSKLRNGRGKELNLRPLIFGIQVFSQFRVWRYRIGICCEFTYFFFLLNESGHWQPSFRTSTQQNLCKANHFIQKSLAISLKICGTFN